MAQCRTILGLDRPEPESDLCRFKMVKSNLAAFPDAWGMEITEDGMIRWEPEGPNETVTELFGKEDEAIHWLCELLRNGPKPVQEVEEQRDKAGISVSTYRRARHTLGIVSLPAKQGQSNMIELPDSCPNGLFPNS